MYTVLFFSLIHDTIMGTTTVNMMAFARARVMSILFPERRPYARQVGTAKTKFSY
jgi:hypothetical protein